MKQATFHANSAIGVCPTVNSAAALGEMAQAGLEQLIRLIPEEIRDAVDVDQWHPAMFVQDFVDPRLVAATVGGELAGVLVPFTQ